MSQPEKVSIANIDKAIQYQEYCNKIIKSFLESDKSKFPPGEMKFNDDSKFSAFSPTKTDKIEKIEEFMRFFRTLTISIVEFKLQKLGNDGMDIANELRATVEGILKATNSKQ